MERAMDMVDMTEHPTWDPEGVGDWHPADVLAALKKRGTSLATLSTQHGYHPTAAGKALKRRWPALETVIAEAIGVPPQKIWPSRYDAEGHPKGRVTEIRAREAA